MGVNQKILFSFQKDTLICLTFSSSEFKIKKRKKKGASIKVVVNIKLLKI